MALLQPIRGSMSTNMQVLQTSVLLKYQTLFAYLYRHHPNVASELHRAYTGAARTYYETGFRRYIRCLTTIKVCQKIRNAASFDQKILQGRSGEPFEFVGSTSERVEATLNATSLEYGSLDGPPVTMAFLADDKSYVRRYP